MLWRNSWSITGQTHENWSQFVNLMLWGKWINYDKLLGYMIQRLNRCAWSHDWSLLSLMHVYSRSVCERLIVLQKRKSVRDIVRRYCGRWWLIAAWSKLKGFQRDSRKKHKHRYSCFPCLIAETPETPWTSTATHKTDHYYHVYFCVF